MTAPSELPPRSPGDDPDPARPPGLPQVRGHQEPLDGIRALAALLVLVFHVGMETGDALEPGVFGALLAAGEFGVPLFFALSGLLLYRPWARAALDGTAGPRVLGYLWRRGLRVLPAYWIVAGTALLLWSREHLDSARAWVEVLTLTFIYNLDPWWNGTGPHGLGQMWSLCVEVSFYLLLPLLALVLAWLAARGGDDVNRRARWLLAGILALGVVAVLALIPQFYPEPRPYLHSWLPRSLGMFAVGMALAVVTEWAWREPGADGPVRRLCRTLSHSATLCGALALIVYLLAATPAAGPRFFGVEGLWVALFSMVMSTLFAFFIVAPIALLPPRHTAPGAPRWTNGAWLGTVLRHPVSRYLGRISYGIFLWQFVVLYLWREFTEQEVFTGTFLFDLAPVAIGTLLLAAATHHWVETPCRRWYGTVGARPDRA
ncbi:peptidoglycan/LPS O-acetylase OafA/YrhL [Lipingzhangella halophila]|uniref:Peptidoglycan/LPS O-acetylase OafA/YrhL n=1 Tax=Lipingzhangella halophila TaxID=1783352 RepID=A0A7W7RKV0_9ACTN|nr:peptidoglycan/LPS O-acetylase OafA/YrhL [Lipingzhangella halophila]